ncbi:MAG: molybdenum cofactor guanylyltransferase [Candidatus Cybelea sp.]
MDSTAIVLLAGGEARRFPGKLEFGVAGRPMLAHCYDRVRAAGWPIYIAAKGSFSPALDELLLAPVLVDRRPGEGPLSALLSACALIRAERIFAVAADQPHLETSVLAQLAAAWQPGDEAVVPVHAGGIEPLAALYARRPLLREGFELRARGRFAMRDAIDRLATRFLPVEARCFRNVNRIEDLKRNAINA